MRLHWLIALSVAFAATISGCADGAPAGRPTAKVALTRSGACGDAFFWAVTGTGELAVTVSVEARDRSTDGPTTLRFELPDDRVSVAVLRGSKLARNLCTDDLDTGAQPESTGAPTAGNVTITLDPSTGCGTTDGSLRVDGLTGDGIAFAPIAVTSDSIGCFSG